MGTRKMVPVIALVAIIVAALGASIAWAGGVGSGLGFGYGAMMGIEPTGQAQPVHTMAAAKERAQEFADRLGLRAGEVMQFSGNYYVGLTEPNGTGATEVLVNPSSGAVSLEYGPAMMWNTRYGMLRAVQSGMMGAAGRGYANPTTGSGYRGMMGSYGGAPVTPTTRSGYRGMMGSYGGAPVTPTTGSGYRGMMWGAGLRSTAGHSVVVSSSMAKRIVNRWLATSEPGTSAGATERFPGYYTIDTVRSGKITGMVSVNAGTGSVMPHWWHGAFLGTSG